MANKKNSLSSKVRVLDEALGGHFDMETEGLVVAIPPGMRSGQQIQFPDLGGRLLTTTIPPGLPQLRSSHDFALACRVRIAVTVSPSV